MCGKKTTLKCHCNPFHFCGKAKPIGREKSKTTIIIIVTFVWINGMGGKKILKYHYNPCHFYTFLQFFESSLKMPLVSMAYFDFQAFWLGTGGKTPK